MMRIRFYKITLRHDSGRVTIQTTASRLAAAVRKVLAAEGAPFGAIVKVEKGEYLI
ncbi:hypothetical protein vB_RpoS-V16_04 [Ruegeria phage vB_RpoS-V16]|uniref:hypothetical protein n=1 Tax=Ruegeria phage vB_RpoS-V16 TaxID=2218618 RepID=UPI000DCACF3D|nr:hypothetical protein JT311_gp04 [Ruegeria phage vB_RpoS-V16]AWY09440.1 hypothetical protein vB_RpoS-V16_04 [Ruegeria phage vB_RpoS-V16]